MSPEEYIDSHKRISMSRNTFLIMIAMLALFFTVNLIDVMHDIRVHDWISIGLRMFSCAIVAGIYVFTAYRLFAKEVKWIVITTGIFINTIYIGSIIYAGDIVKHQQATYYSFIAITNLLVFCLLIFVTKESKQKTCGTG